MNHSNWVVLQIYNSEKDDTIYKLMRGYLDGGWTINSGIVKVEEVDGLFRFHGVSGSVYDCHPVGEATTGEMARVIAFYQQRYPEASITVVPLSDIKAKFLVDN